MGFMIGPDNALLRGPANRWGALAGLLTVCALCCGADVDPLRLKAEKGDVQAMIALGLQYRDGRGGLKRDAAKAVLWFRRAVDRGSAAAYDHLGYMYLKGAGVPSNLSISTGFFRASAKGGWLQGQHNFAQSCFFGRGMECDLPLAAQQWKAAAGDGHVRASFWFGYCLLNGLGVEQDKAKALVHLEAAAKGRDPDAWWLLGEYYYRASDGKQLEKARLCWAKAKEHASYKQMLTTPECAAAKARGAVVGKRQFLPVPHLDQGWNLCGITATAVVLRYQGRPADPRTIKRNAPNSPFGTGTAWDKINLSLKKLYGFTWDLKTFPFDAKGAEEGLTLIRKELDEGNPVLIDVRGADAKGGAHTVTVVGYDRDTDSVYIQDTARFAPGVITMPKTEFIQRWNSQGFITNATGEVLRPLLLTGRSRKRSEE